MLLSDQQTVTVALWLVTMSYPCYDSCVRYNNQENQDYAITSVMHGWQLAIIHLKRKNEPNIVKSVKARWCLDCGYRV